METEEQIGFLQSVASLTLAPTGFGWRGTFAIAAGRLPIAEQACVSN
jgi:hypothetical protein